MISLELPSLLRDEAGKAGESTECKTICLPSVLHNANNATGELQMNYNIKQRKMKELIKACKKLSRDKKGLSLM